VSVSVRRRVVASLLQHSAALSTSTSASSVSFDVEKFCESFVKNVEGVAVATDPAQSSRELRKLVKSKALKFTDMQENPEKFFMAHRLLSTVGKSELLFGVGL
jgi:hypothetical protein